MAGGDIMAKIIGVRFRQAGKIYYYSPEDLEPQLGDHVIVETKRGIEYGTVAFAAREIPSERLPAIVKNVIRIATPEDDWHYADNQRQERKALEICEEKVKYHKLAMDLVRAEYTFDNNRLIFFFKAEHRVDFRELVKDLASTFHTRIELLQIGIRDVAKMLGGIGICGRPLCCTTYMQGFYPVSIKMAKNQNLSLNPEKISGMCGRLMCCLSFEDETYTYLNAQMPRKGDYVKTADDLEGEVVGIDILKQSARVIVNLDHDEREQRDYPVSELKFTRGRKPDRKFKEAVAQAAANKEARENERLEKSLERRRMQKNSFHKAAEEQMSDKSISELANIASDHSKSASAGKEDHGNGNRRGRRNARSYRAEHEHEREARTEQHGNDRPRSNKQKRIERAARENQERSLKQLEDMDRRDENATIDGGRE